jgi:hypothetical protein
MAIRQIIILTFLFLYGHAFGQNFILPDGEYMDTTSIQDTKDTACFISPYNYYYSFGAKYPENSASLLNEAQLYLQKKHAAYCGSGYITLRFSIDCEGRMTKKVQVLQTNEQYTSYHFERALVNELYAFLQTLVKWKVANPLPGKNFYYMTFVTFKIRNGKIINIIP